MFDLFSLLQWTALLLFIIFARRGMAKTFKRNALGAVFSLILLPIWIIWSIVELFRDEVDPEHAKKQLKRLKYIGVWLLVAVVNGILGRIVSSFLAMMIIQDLGDLDSYFIVASIFLTLMSIGVIISIYNIFSTLNMRKVFPYSVISGILGMLVSMGQMNENIRNFNWNIDLTTFRISLLISFLVIVCSIRAYYIRKSDRWY